jgi:outer membrane protein assembly complex protein YaeT
MAIGLAAPALGQPTPSVSAAAAAVGRRVTSVVLQVEGRPTTDAALLDLIETPVGEPLSMMSVRETLTHLFNIGRFQGIEVLANDAADGTVALEYRMTPLQSVAAIRFAGTAGIDDDDLRRIVEERFGAAPPVGRADAAARTLEQYLARRGFLNARVQPDVSRGSNGTVLTFTVDAGARARVGAVTVTGVKDTYRVAALIGLQAGAPYERDRVDERLGAYVESLRRRGYYEATGDHRSTSREGNAVVDVVVDVHPGPVVKLAFEGDPLPRNRIDELVPVVREGSVDEDLLEDSDRRIRDFLLEQGYWKADASHRREQSNGVETVTFTVTRGPKFVAGAIDISGNENVPIGTLRLLFPFEPGDPFVEGRMAAAIAAIRAEYLQRGFTDPTIEAAYVPAPGDAAQSNRVDTRIVIREGAQTRIGSVVFEGNAVLSDEQLRGATKVQPGAIFHAPLVSADRDSVHLQYLNDGYAETTVAVEPVFSQDRTRVDLTYRIRESPRVVVDHILVVGNTRTSEATIRRELLVAPAKPLALDDVLESQRRLMALGLFRRVRISEVPHGAEPRRDIIVTVEEADRTTLAYGGGLEATQRTALAPDGTADERLEIAPRGSFEIGRRNLWGGNRSVSLFTRVSFRPRGESLESPDANYGFNEYRVLGTYREIGFLGRQAELGVSGFVEQAIRSSFNFHRRGVNGELQRRVSPSVRFVGRYSFGRTRLFDERIAEDEQLAIDRIFPQVRLASVSVSMYRDTRDDALDPTRGWLLGSDTELAARVLGSQVGFAKTYFQAFGFRTLSRESGVVFAGAMRLGLARGFNQIVNGLLVEAELPASERFFAGGSTTVRGFELDKLGSEETISDAGFPLGGNALVVMNAEVRATVWRDVGAVLFLDAGNVFSRPSTFDVTEIRVTPGFGLRYRSPIGPIRVDLGFKIQRRELSPGNLEGRTAFHISVGHAF